MKTIGIMALFAALMLSTVSAYYVGDEIPLEITLECAGKTVDSDLSDGQATYIFYSWEITDSVGTIAGEWNVLYASNQITLNIPTISTDADTYTLSGEMIFYTIQLSGQQFTLVDSGLCDSEVHAEAVDPAPVCGNSILEGDEECDDGNTVSGDECSDICEFEYCGDGVVQTGIGEQCDVDLNGGTCQTEGYLYGELDCNSCQYDLAQCTNDGGTAETYQPIEDAKVASAQPGSRFGLGRYAMIRDYSGAKDRFWMQFDISGSQMQSANSALLELWVYYTNSEVVGYPIDVLYCDGVSFNEATITWFNQPDLSGCVFVSDYSPTARTIAGGGADPVHEWDLSSIIDAELAGDGQFSLVVKYDPETQSRSTDHWSMYLTSNYAESDFRPTLTIS